MFFHGDDCILHGQLSKMQKIFLYLGDKDIFPTLDNHIQGYADRN